jgi:hypothetical protein
MITFAMNFYVGSELMMDSRLESVVTRYGIPVGRLPIKPDVSVVKHDFRERKG